MSFYAFIDCMHYAVYLFDCIKKTMEKDLKKELDCIVAYDKIKTDK